MRETGSPEYFHVAFEPDPAGRWGTFAVKLEVPMVTGSEAGAYIRALLPKLIPYWRAGRTPGSTASLRWRTLQKSLLGQGHESVIEGS